MKPRYTIKHVPHVPGLGTYVVVDANGTRVYPKSRDPETLGACQRWIETHPYGPLAPIGRTPA